MADTILDSSVLIDYLRGHAPARAYLDPVLASGNPTTHAVVAAELIEGARDKPHLRSITRFLSQFEFIEPAHGDIEHSLELLRTHKLASGVGWPDCLIAATCLRVGSDFDTLNDRHFRVFRGLHTSRPY